MKTVTISVEEHEKLIQKGKKYDELENEIWLCYYDENDEERGDEFDLVTIGEIAATHFGHL